MSKGRERKQREKENRAAMSQNRPPKICTSQSLEPIKLLPYMAKETLQM